MALLFFPYYRFFFLSSNRFLTCLILQFTIYIFSIYIFSFTIYIFSICTPILLIPHFLISHFIPFCISHLCLCFRYSCLNLLPSPGFFRPTRNSKLQWVQTVETLFFFPPPVFLSHFAFRVPRVACRVSRVTRCITCSALDISYKNVLQTNYNTPPVASIGVVYSFLFC